MIFDTFATILRTTAGFVNAAAAHADADASEQSSGVPTHVGADPEDAADRDLLRAALQGMRDDNASAQQTTIDTTGETIRP